MLQKLALNIGLACGLILSLGCSVDSARHHYFLAERLWGDKSYAAAVAEFERVIAKDPSGTLGQQALYRAGMTQALFLGQYVEAIQKFKGLIQLSHDEPLVWSAQNQIGDILFSQLGNYDQAISHYQNLIKTYPNSSEVPAFMFRVAKSQFFLFQFAEAIQQYQEIITRFPQSNWAEKASLEIGTTYFTRGQRQGKSRDSEPSDFKRAMDAFQKVVQKDPKSEYSAEARFGIASCLEELDQLGEAQAIYAELKSIYPAPQVIEIKLRRIKERLAHRMSKR